MASDPEASGAAALAAQVVGRLGTDVQLLGELLHRQRGLEDAGDDDGGLERGGRRVGRGGREFHARRTHHAVSANSWAGLRARQLCSLMQTAESPICRR